MDYAMMSGGDVVPLGMSAVSELHHLFDWAQASRRGVLLLMDEADAFLRSRDSSDMGEYMRSALNAVLSRTGERYGLLVTCGCSSRKVALEVGASAAAGRPLPTLGIGDHELQHWLTPHRRTALVL